MQVDKYNSLRIENGHDDNLLARYSNRGEPFREGVELTLSSYGEELTVFLDEFEVKQLQDFLKGAKDGKRRSS